MGSVVMLVSLQNSLKAFHCDVMVFMVLGAQACCWMYLIPLARCLKKPKIKLKFKHFRSNVALSRCDSDGIAVTLENDPVFLGTRSCESIGQPISLCTELDWLGPVVELNLMRGVQAGHA